MILTMENQLLSTLEYLLFGFEGVDLTPSPFPKGKGSPLAARVESLRGRMSPTGIRSEAGRQACTERSRSVEGLSPTLRSGDTSRFESLLADAFS
jgi:hypothetical protein